MFGEEDMRGLEAVGLNPIIIDENTNFDDLDLDLTKLKISKTNGKRNKQAGHSWERELVKRINQLGFNVGTTRNLSRIRDAQKVDIMALTGNFPVNIQAKNESRVTKFQKHLSEMPIEPGIQNVIAFKQTSKANSKFVKQGEYAIMYLDSFLYYLEIEKEYQKLKEEFEQYKCNQNQNEC